MASNFKFSTYRNSENIHIKLFGDFDITSALELIHFMEKSSDAVSKIFIHTSSLKQIFPYDKEILQDHLDFLNKGTLLLLLTGEEASKLAPENHKYIQVLAH